MSWNIKFVSTIVLKLSLIKIEQFFTIRNWFCIKHSQNRSL